MAAKKSKEKLLRRRIAGIYVAAGGGKATTGNAHLIYEEDWSVDGTWKLSVLARGNTIYGYQGLIHNEKLDRLRYRADLQSRIFAVATLLQDLEHACRLLDEAAGTKETK